MKKVIVVVKGGNVQDIISDSDEVGIMVIDYDNESVAKTANDRTYTKPHIDVEWIRKAESRTEDE